MTERLNKAKEAMQKAIANTSVYNDEERKSKLIFLIIAILLTLASIALGAANLGLFIGNIRTFTTTNAPFTVNLASGSVLFYIWIAAGIYSFMTIIEAIIGLQVRNARSKVALAYIIIGPFVIVMALLQSAAGVLLFVIYYFANQNNLQNGAFLLSLIDLGVALLGIVIIIWILAVWLKMLIKRSKKDYKKKKRPFNENPNNYDEYAEEDDEEDEEDDEDDDDEVERAPRRKRQRRPYPLVRNPVSPRKPEGGPTTIIQQITGPQQPSQPQPQNPYAFPYPTYYPQAPPQTAPQPAPQPVPQPASLPPQSYFPSQPSQTFKPKVIIVNPRVRNNPYRPPMYPPPVPPMGRPMYPYQPFFPGSNLPLAYQPRY